MLEKIIKDWIELYPEGKILKYGTNALDETLVAVYSNSVVYLLGRSYPTIMYAPKIILSRVDEQHWHIEDILMKHNDIGNGSFAMTALLEYAADNNIKLITGHLSPVDNDHKSRRDHYYKKFGFIVTENSIRKELNSDEK
jgi:hypothetical protein